MALSSDSVSRIFVIAFLEKINQNINASIALIHNQSLICCSNKFIWTSNISLSFHYCETRGGGGVLNFELGTDVRPEVLTTTL